MSKFTSLIIFTTEFDGDKVEARMERMKNPQLGRMMPFVTKAENGKMNISFGEKGEFLDIAREILTKVVKEFRGLKDADGNVLELSRALEETYFLPLITQMLTYLFDNSFLKVEEEKKSVP